MKPELSNLESGRRREHDGEHFSWRYSLVTRFRNKRAKAASDEHASDLRRIPLRLCMLFAEMESLWKASTTGND